MTRGIGRRVFIGALTVATIAAALILLTDRGESNHNQDVDVAATLPPTDPTTVAPATTRGPRGSGNSVTLAFAGDVTFPEVWYSEGGPPPNARPLSERVRTDPDHLLDAISPVLANADLTMVNLETAITDAGAPVEGKRYHFRSPAASLDALQAAGVDVVNMANNHALDYGPDGLRDTLAAIRSSKMPVTGIGGNAAEAYRPYRTTVKGQRIAIVSANDWLEPELVDGWSATDTQGGIAFSIDPIRLLTEVRAVRPQVDTLIAFLHWGTEDTWCASGEQQELATALLEAGADIIVGSHTHRVFGAGTSGPALVAYGLGNFVYWREDGESGRTGVLKVTVTGREVDGYDWVPARITDGVPVPATGSAAAADLAEWNRRRACSGLTP